MCRLLCGIEVGVKMNDRQPVVPVGGRRQVAVVYRHMSTPNESTRLISTSSHADPQRHRLADQHADSSIEARSQAILTSLKADVDGPIQLDSGPVNLLILLYASHRLRDFLKGLSAGDDGIVSMLAWERLESGVRDRLDSEIGKVLDSLGRGEVDDETLYEALWRRWEVGHRRVSGKSPMILRESADG